MGIEPTSEAWEASILPLYDARSVWNQSQDSIVAMGGATIGEGILVSNPRLRFRSRRPPHEDNFSHRLSPGDTLN